MIRCKTCVMPSTRPDTPFIDGECQACINHRNRPNINWAARKAELIALLDRHDGRVIVPSSGGKDSTYQVLTLLELGADVTIVTARTCHLTPIGRANIDNLARYARTFEVVPNMAVRAKLNRLGLEMVGDISWPEHVAIFTTPFKVAEQLGITLIMYGENPQDQYGGPQGTEGARQLTQRWRSEFGGFLGLRPADMVGLEGITDKDMDDYRLHPWSGGGADYREAHFLGQYIEWDSRRNLEVAEAAGMQAMIPTDDNWWRGENLDNAQTGIHDYFAYLKYGYTRGCAQISVDVRTARMVRTSALDWVTTPNESHEFPTFYMGEYWQDILARIGMSPEQYKECVMRFTNFDLFTPSDPWPKLKDWRC